MASASHQVMTCEKLLKGLKTQVFQLIILPVNDNDYQDNIKAIMRKAEWVLLTNTSFLVAVRLPVA